MSRRLRDLACATLVVLAAGCASSPTSTTAEKTFVAQMIPHHELGMRLMDIAATRADDVRLRRLVFEMGGYHHSDMASLSKWSFEWGVKPSGDFPGDLPDTTLDRLATFTGAEFDEAWLDAMIDHHEGALAISRGALADDVRAEIREMARTTLEVQSREIDEMSQLIREFVNAPS